MRTDNRKALTVVGTLPHQASSTIQLKRSHRVPMNCGISRCPGAQFRHSTGFEKRHMRTIGAATNYARTGSANTPSHTPELYAVAGQMRQKWLANRRVAVGVANLTETPHGS